LADNRIALSSGWDEAMLANELQDLHADEIDLGLTGFDADELGKLLGLDDEEIDLPDSSTQEINTDNFQMQCKCPRCQFEFDPPKA
jgi:hypothetical protein